MIGALALVIGVRVFSLTPPSELCGGVGTPRPMWMNLVHVIATFKLDKGYYPESLSELSAWDRDPRWKYPLFTEGMDIADTWDNPLDYKRTNDSYVQTS